MAEHTRPCPVCKREIPHVKDWPAEIFLGTHGDLAVPPASAVYRCHEDGDWRIYSTGAFEKVRMRA